MSLLQEEPSPPILETIQLFIDGIIQSAKKSSCKITGSAFFEDGQGVPIPVMYSTFPSGNFLTWVMVDEYFHLLALVNDNSKEVVKIHVSQLDELQKKIGEIKENLS